MEIPLTALMLNMHRRIENLNNKKLIERVAKTHKTISSGRQTDMHQLLLN